MKTLSILFVLLWGAIGYATAQSAVYVCSETGAYGFCYGDNNASSCAKTKCQNYGGQSCYSVASVSSQGFGAVAVGKSDDGRTIVGAGVGYASPTDARNRALSECRSRGGSNCRITDTFNDN